MGGMSPSRAERLGRLWPIARSRPLLTNVITAGAGVNVHCDSLAITEATEGPPPLYGTCTDWKFANCRKYAPERWLCEPEPADRSEEHTSELQSRFGISYAVFCLKK